MPNPQGFLFRSGGLYRCCIQTLFDLAQKQELPNETGQTVTCLYCKQEPTLRLANDGVWQASFLSLNSLRA